MDQYGASISAMALLNKSTNSEYTAGMEPSLSVNILSIFALSSNVSPCCIYGDGMNKENTR